MHQSASRIVVSLIFLTSLALPLLAGAQAVPQHSPVVTPEEHHDVSPPLSSIPPAARQPGQRVHDIELLSRPATEIVVDPMLQRNVPTRLAPAPILNFSGVGQGFTGPNGSFTVNSAPPDTDGDVGPNHFVQIVNSDFAIFNKSGSVIYGPVPTNTLWSGFGGLCQSDNDGDGVAVHDSISDRWIISQFAVTGANGTSVKFLQCVAVSQTADPTGAYNRYSFPYSSFNDYPKLSVWPDAYYTTFNFFNGNTFVGGEVCAYDRTKMLAGMAATQQCFNVGTNYGGLLAATLVGAQQPPAGSPNYVLALGVSNNDLAFWKLHVDWTTPANTTLTGPATITVAVYNALCGGGTCVPQTGTAQQLDSLADRLMQRLVYRNFGTHESLMVNHSVTPGTGGGVRWYEIRSPGTTPTVFQQGTYAPDSNFRWMGSIAMDQSGDMALGFSMSSSSLHPEILYTGRLATDPLGSMAQGEATIIAGGGSQTANLARWGDYSMVGVDPADDCTFWVTNEYIPSNGTFNWKTQIAAFKFPGCGAPVNDFSISANPASLSLLPGTQGMSTVSTTLVSGSAEAINLSVSGVPSGATATFNPTSVMAGGSSTLTVNSGTAATGTYMLTVTGTAPSATHSTSVSLTVTQAPAITSAASTTFTVLQPRSFTVTTTGNPTPAISESGTLPTGVNFVDNHNGTGTLSGTPALGTNNTYNITFTAANGVGSNAMQAFTLTVNPPPPPTLGSINPTSGGQGAAVGVTLTGTNFISGATINFSGTGITPSAVTIVNSTTITATYTIAANAPLGGQNVSVTTAGGTSGTVSFTVTPALPVPTLASITPSSTVQGAIISVTLTGTNFISGATINVSGTGVTPSGVTVMNGTTITATFTIATNATLGAHNVSVITSGGTSGTVPFTVNAAPGAPTLTAPPSPQNLAEGNAYLVTLTGTNFVPGNTAINLSYTGVTVSNVSVLSSTSMTATFTIAANAAVGTAPFTVSTPFGTSGTRVIDVIGVPIISTISPTNANTGTSLTVTLTGSQFLLAQIQFSGTGITASNRVINSSFTQLTYTFTIASGATPGPQTATLTNAAGTSNGVTFTINGTVPAPTLTNISPTSGNQGQTVTTVTLTGTNLTGATINALSGITVSNVVASASQVTATFAISTTAPIGGQSVTVTTAGGTSNGVTFTVTVPPPTLTMISPTSGNQGQTITTVTLTGTNLTGATINALSGITVSNVVASASQVTATFAISATAPTGGQSVTVTTAGGTSNGVTFTVNSSSVGPPTLTAPPSPGVIALGSSILVTLTGTNFVPGNTTINLSYTGLSASNVSVLSSTSLTATFTAAANSPLGTATFTVSTPNGTSGFRGIDVIGVPVLNSITPTSGSRGTSFSVTLSGSQFFDGQIHFSGTGITATNRVINGSFTTLTYTFTIAAGAPTGPQSVTVTNAAGTSAPVTFTVQ